MKEFTRSDKERGEMLVRGLSKEARDAYSMTDEFDVYVDLEDRIYVRGCLGSLDNTTEEELEELLLS